MEKVSMQDLRKIQTDILIDVCKFCAENNLRHWICGGTLIGAVRHKGYIPWDDDIDIAMPRPDFTKFINTYKSSKYNLFYVGIKGYYIPEGKVSDRKTILKQRCPATIGNTPLGVHIDIIPQDGQPDDFEEFKKLHDKINRLRNASLTFRLNRNRAHVFSSPIAIAKQIFRNIIYIRYSLDKAISDIDSLAQTHKYDESRYVGCMTCVSPYGYKERFERKWFEGDVVYMEFEGNLFPAPSGWKEYLTYMYGDYMQLPPVEKQKSEHNWTAFWLE